jgi:hypothetical protein
MNAENENKINLVELLKKYGNVVDYMTSDMVASLYGVGERAIADIGTTKKDELSKYGYKVYKKSEILNMELPYLENIPNRGLRLYPIKAVIVIGMMLIESKVAEQLRSDIMNILFGNEVAIPNETTIRNIVSTELDKKMPQLIGSKDVYVKEYTKTVKRELHIKKKDVDYENIMGMFTTTHNVTRLEDIPYSPQVIMELVQLCRKYMEVIYKKKQHHLF